MAKKKNVKRKLPIKKIITLFTALCIFGLSIIILWVSTLKIPDLSGFDERIVAQSTKIYDRTGEILLYDVHEDIRRTVVSYDEISLNIKNAAVAIEDAEFYQHNGIKIASIIRAVFSNILAGSYTQGQGGSTITQQVVKNSILTQEKKISRKIKEWVLAVKLEKVLSKEEILTLYLNESPYGGNLYGIEEASLSFFGKNSKDLTLSEAAYLAAIPQAPTYYSPYGDNVEALEKRKNLVLLKMLENKFIKQDEYDEAKNEKKTFREKETKGIKAPHFVMYIKQYLEEKYGESASEEGGLKVITTLDYDLQKKAEEIAKKYALENDEKFSAENIAMAVIDIKNGQILTMVGSRDYFDEEIDGNFNVATSHRQPGSAFKPFVYAAAFNEGYTPDTVVFNVRTEFSTYCSYDGKPLLSQYEGRCYYPENYDYQYTGPMTLRNALAQSVNIPAIKTLYLVGIKDALKTAKDLGIDSLTNVDQYGLTLVLGGGEVSPLDITSAYSVFANNGLRNPHTGILKIENSEGEVIEEFEQKQTRVLPEQTALYITDILSDNEARTPAFGTNSPLYFPGRDVAAKTGTTNDYRDAWTVGYTAQVALGVWAGNNDNSSMEKKVAGFIVAPVWNAFMQEILTKYPDEKFKKIEIKYDESLKPVLRGLWKGGTSYFVDKISGKLATEYTPEELKEERVIEDFHSILYWIDKNNPLGEKPANPSNDPQFGRWEYSVQKWIQANNLYANNTTMPTSYDDIHTPELSPKIKMIYPDANTTYNPNDKINVVTSSVGVTRYPLTTFNYYLNGNYIGSSKTGVFSFTPSETSEVKGDNELKVIVFDSVLNKGETTTRLKVNIY
ncbi:hypothetical protein A2442_01835 [Candidatus Campbellbacteria bacterium RIFOXYC2_FULL_35_25]|uniref:Uncharacterized protein n=1 Tax=Candidatus Campbellbacteria bacterium RIFOXYC2_FULL_35_25 TaxID=1797582 RepID=A0A1F5EI67_9BACT|nr:MAG: hypothetical protein A2442_01835 [Candidatus Campbellbacteria bacterium RIFOXYC2_FULL_35_25]